MPVENIHRPGISTFMNNTDPICNGINAQSEYASDSSASQRGTSSRKEKTSSIFSFLQRFRVKNRNIFDENVTSLPSSPRTIRRHQKPRSRWESAESVLSTATANSFAFIPPSQLRGGPRLLHPSAAPEPSSPASQPPSVVPINPDGDNTVFLRRKYNLLGSEVSLCPNDRKRCLKPLYRNSIGNVENITTDDDWRQENIFSSFRRSTKPPALTRRPKSEYSLLREFNTAGRRVQCHRPGKGRAPPPPTIETNNSKARTKSTSRKKRKAPLPPINKAEVMNADIIEEVAKIEEEEEDERPEEKTVCNDSLKLEKGQLKANNTSLTINTTNLATSSSDLNLPVPVSPKPWYKRSSVRNNKKTSSKKKSPEQLLDEWILEAGLPRSSSFCSNRDRKTVDTSNAKRKSQISMLANISELDREAAEIVKKERMKEFEKTCSFNNRFYDPSPTCGKSTSWNEYVTPQDVNVPSGRHTSKDLISILNAITNVTKITVNANIFKDMSINRSTSRRTGATSSHSDINLQPENKSKEKVDLSNQQNKLTITEITDSEKKTPTSESNKVDSKEEVSKDPAPQEKRPNVPPNVTPKPMKPFSSWICPQCTLENPSWKFICEACNKWRPYSVNKLNGRPTPLVTPKEDVTNNIPQVGKPVRDPLIQERDEIRKISESIRKQVYDILTSGENVRNNLSRLKFTEEQKTKMGSTKESSEAPRVDTNDDIEETRRARLAFFSKNALNDLNSSSKKPVKVSTPDSARAKNKYYNEEDRKKLREILKELKDSLPTTGSQTLKKNVVKQSFNGASPVNDEKKENNKFDELKEKLDLAIKRPSEIKSSSGSTASPEPIYSVPIKKSEATGRSKSKLEEKNLEIVSVLEKRNTKVIVPPMEERRDIDSDRITDVKQLTDSKGASKENKSTTHLMVNRLLKKLQTAIASGQHHEAANIARELARLKVNCNMTRQETPDFLESSPKNVNVSVHLHIRQNAIHLAPILLKLNSNLTINELRDKVCNKYDVSSEKQVWMVRGKLIEDESASLEQLGANESEAFDLYMYSSSDNGNSSSMSESKVVTNKENPTKKLLNNCNRTTATNDEALRYPSYVLVMSGDTGSKLPSTPPGKTDANNDQFMNVDQKEPTSNLNTTINTNSKNLEGIDDRERRSKSSTLKNEIQVVNAGTRMIEPSSSPPQNEETNGTTHISHSHNKLKNAQIMSKVEKNMKLKNKTPVASTLINESDQTIKVNCEESNRILLPRSNKSEIGISMAKKYEEKEPAMIAGREIEKLKNKLFPEKERLTDETEASVSKILPSTNDTNLNSSDEWKCSRCTLINSTKEKNCAVCGSKKQDLYSSGEIENGNETIETQKITGNDKISQIDRLANYKELISMEKSDIILNVETFDCSVCLMAYEPGEGVILKDCLHTFCKECLAQTVQHSSEAEVKCPFRDAHYSCESVLQEREIKALVTPKIYEEHLTRSVKEAEQKIQNTFHCKTLNCCGWCIFEDNVNEFLCPVCDKTNCLTCQVIHTGLNCKQYQEIINQESETNADANRTRLILLEMLEKKDAMMCPTCQVILMKKWGCDWLRCTMCKTEICWVTRGPRWGPKGKGDTSGGCRCGVKGIKCHPRCSYCH